MKDIENDENDIFLLTDLLVLQYTFMRARFQYFNLDDLYIKLKFLYHNFTQFIN